MNVPVFKYQISPMKYGLKATRLEGVMSVPVRMISRMITPINILSITRCFQR
jgi:hypothetical protein